MVLNELWLPEGVTYTRPKRPLGYNVETGGTIVLYVFQFHDKRSGRRSKAMIPANIGESRAYIEDLAATAFGNWLEEIRTEENKRAPTEGERKEIGRALDEFRRYALKRRESGNARIYYEGIK